MSNDTERGEVHEGREQSPPVIAEQICEWAGWKGIVFLHFLERRSLLDGKPHEQAHHGDNASDDERPTPSSVGEVLSADRAE